MDLGELTKKALDFIEYDAKPLNSGADGVIFIIDRAVVLKLHRGIPGCRVPHFYHGSSRASAEYEFNIGKELYQKGIQVPQFFTLFEPHKAPLDYWGIFMERIYGKEYKSLPFLLKREAKKQFKEQERLIEIAGYKLGDCSHDYNTLFDIEKRKLYLFDLVRWQKR